MPVASMHSGVCGRYRLTVRRSGAVIQQTPWFDNLIVNNGLDLLGTRLFSRCMPNCYVGTGNAAPQNTDTSLAAQIASTGNRSGGENGSQTNSSPYYHRRVYTYRFSKGAAQGNLQEVGVGRGSSNLFSRALILDEQGNPTTLTITDIDILDVEYEFRLYINETGNSWSDTVNSTSYSGTVSIIPSTVANADKPYPMDDPSEDVYFYDGNGNSKDSGDLINHLSYTNTTYYREFKIHAGIYTANYPNGIGKVIFGNVVRSLRVQWDCSPAVPKDNTKEFDLTLRCTWARYTIP